MEIRTARQTDRSEIASVARASLTDSYSHFVDESTIDTVVDQWYADEWLAELLDDAAETFVVAEDDDEIVGFAHGAVVEERPRAAELYWLHVTPSKRGERIGLKLLGHIQDRFEDSDATVLRGMVLAGNEAGAGFYTAQGFEQSETRTVDIGGEEFEELVFERSLGEEPAEQIVEPAPAPDGRELFVNYSESERGARGPFYAVYLDRELEDRYGFCCGNCESVETPMDSMGRIRCANCGNKRKATRWDASYL
ncbi:MAG: GNAT family N-acetyltransferase [Halobacteriota archaeon]